MTKKIDLKNLSEQMLVDYVTGAGMQAFRARQLFSWLYRPGITSFEQMTDLSKEFRTELAKSARISRLVPEIQEKSEDGTIKFGFLLEDGYLVESVLIPEEDRNTLCVSSQVGCAMGCAFCLTGKMGLKRNLEPSEIVNQVCAVIDSLPDEACSSGDKKSGCINNLVFMGMGEPLANLDNLLVALDIIMDQRGLDFSGRRVTVSTCGLVPKMRQLGEKAPVNLAVSLHSVKDSVRDELMPVNRKYPVDKLLEACRTFPLPRRRMIMFEYIMIKGLNDSLEDARELVAKLKDIRCKINLLPYNACPGMPYERPSIETIEAFQNVLRKAGFSVFIRFSRGSDISAACGQLAGTYGK
ncbi:MAG: 23S rRNA (adenine(2503)-C(2))-methyltransferase RlmN [Proteobacteria bacterium]|nr:23S rRNA (adenine(2503)-C(2))-methyltransferase RlmN [Pseudomonadota bacterium]MBU1739058.1 23S rRNA (adenine(2503)-C(2))-methyltransferase RlmN [Pseudomonadota bacterium]